MAWRKDFLLGFPLLTYVWYGDYLCPGRRPHGSPRTGV